MNVRHPRRRPRSKFTSRHRILEFLPQFVIPPDVRVVETQLRSVRIDLADRGLRALHVEARQLHLVTGLLFIDKLLTVFFERTHLEGTARYQRKPGATGALHEEWHADVIALG